MTDAPEEHKLQPQRKKKPPQMQPNGLQSRMWRVEGIVDSCCGHVSWSRPCDGSALVHRDSAKNSAPRLRGTSFSMASPKRYPLVTGEEQLGCRALLEHRVVSSDAGSVGSSDCTPPQEKSKAFAGLVSEATSTFVVLLCRARMR